MPIEEPALRSWQRPFLKWAGGKYSLLPELDRLIPAGKRLIEPFVGGGSVFLNSDKHERFSLLCPKFIAPAPAKKSIYS